MTDPAIALIQNLADRILDLIAALNVMDDCELAALAPVGPPNIFHHLSRRASRQRRAGQRTSFNFQVSPCAP